MLIGAKGAGKTLHGRLLAKKFGVFHISFKDRLQELIIHKTLKRIGPDYEVEDGGDEETDGNAGIEIYFKQLAIGCLYQSNQSNYKIIDPTLSLTKYSYFHLFCFQLKLLSLVKVLRLIWN